MGSYVTWTSWGAVLPLPAPHHTSVICWVRERSEACLRCLSLILPPGSPGSVHKVWTYPKEGSLALAQPAK